MALSKTIQNTNNNHYTVRCMREEELDEVLEIMLEHKSWFVQRKKVEMLFRTVEDSIYVITDSRNNKILGCLMVTPAHSYDAVIGKMIVPTEYRGQGLGSQLLKSVVDKSVKSGKTLSLFSERDEFYEKNGFRKYQPACATLNYLIKPDAHLIDIYGKANPLDRNTHISLYSNNNHFDGVVSYDSMDQGYENRSLMNFLMCTSDTAIVAINKTNQGIVGYATAAFAPVEKTLVICGLKADSDVIAFWLFRTLLQAFPDLSEVRMSVLRKDPFLIQFGKISRCGRAFNRMVIGEGDVTISHEKLYVTKGLDFTY